MQTEGASPPSSGPLAELLTEFDLQLNRTSDWLNGLPITKFGRHRDATPLSESVRTVIVAQVRATEELAGWSQRDIPEVAVSTLGAQLRVVGRELAATVSAGVAAGRVDWMSANIVLMKQISNLLTLRTSLDEKLS